MGVPILFSWLNQKHPECIKKEPCKHTDNLYIDLNALIHNCYNSNLDSIECIHEDMAYRLKAAIDNIMEKVRPTKILYIAVDGVAPAAKMSHQRARRYKAACEKQAKSAFASHAYENERITLDTEMPLYEKFVEEKAEVQQNNDVAKQFDSNAITPGTELMEYLHTKILEMLMYNLSTDDKYKNIKVIYSSYLVPGEGEQKIMHFIRRYHALNPNDVHVMYSPDGDIIFLGVGLYDVTMYIMREDTYGNKNKKVLCTMCGKTGHYADQCGRPECLIFSYIDVPEFRNVLVRTFNFVIKSKYNHRRMLVDWVLVCFLLGNDFLPGLPCVDIKIASIELLTNTLCKNFLYCKDYITAEDKAINFHVLEKFLVCLSRLEDSLYVTKSQMLNRFCEQGREEIPLQTRQGKMKYYATKMYAHSQVDIDNIAIEYITGMIWIYNYYIIGRTDWQWVYPYHFAPFARDLANITRANFSLKRGSPLSPFEQLLVVIPPQSSDIISDKLRFVYDKYKQYYPLEVKCDMFDKYLSWTSVILLPDMNSKLVLADAKKRINEIPCTELTRNARESDLLITADAKSIEGLQHLYFNLKPAAKFLLEGLDLNVFSYYKTIFPGDECDSIANKKFINKTITVRFDLV